ncbi:unnamed protein product, partial [Dibothriocephalus latus]
VAAQTEKAACSSAFFRAAAFSRLFFAQVPVSVNSSADLPELTASAASPDKVRAHETWLGNFIFMPYLRDSSDSKVLLKLLDESFQSAEYSLVLLTYCILSLPPTLNRDELVNRTKDLLDPLLTKYLTKTPSSHGLFLHPDFPAILTSHATFGALILTKVYHSVLQRLEVTQVSTFCLSPSRILFFLAPGMCIRREN